jgi:hypothetical protein
VKEFIFIRQDLSETKPLIPRAKVPQTHLTWTTKLLFVVLFLDFCAVVGCHRGYYRRQADRDAKCLIEQKATDPRWNTITGSIEIDPYSRMFNPFSSDHPPIPPDDPTAQELMNCVDGKRGYPHWKANGNTDFVENPEWKAYLPRNGQGQVVLTLDRAFQLALLHSPEYQAQLETVYLSALDVSLERFGFDTQLFAGFNSFAQRRGRARTGSGTPSTQIISGLGANNEGIRLRRLGTAGANYAIGLANTILFNISGPSSRSANSLIDFSVIQPLLRNAGRDRVMEALTQTERTLLANVRQLERYRRGFYLQIATGRSPGLGPIRAGSLLAQPAGASVLVGGYYGLLIQQSLIRNLEFNVRQLESVLEQFRELYLVGRLDAFQLRLFESTVFGQQSELVTARIRYQTALDRFMQLLGLPPDLAVLIQDPALDQFQLISEDINDRLIEISKLRRQTGLQSAVIVDLLPRSEDVLLPPAEGERPAVEFAWSDELGEQVAKLIPFLDEAQKILTEIENRDFDSVRRDLNRLDSVRDDRIQYLNQLKGSSDAEDIVNVLDASLYAAESIPTKESLLAILEGMEGDVSKPMLVRLRELHSEMEQIKTKILDLKTVGNTLAPLDLFRFVKGIEEQIPEQLAALNNNALELSLIQARARANSVEIIDVNIDSQTAIEMARCFRRDWMNARASLVDNWRRIEFVADQLESQLDLVFQAEMGTIGSNPLNFRDANGQIRAGFRFDSPIVRMIERNQYRETLIRYSQARRQYYQFEDEVKRNLREIIRNLNRDKVLFELNRTAIQNQIEQIELSRLNLDAPQPIPSGDASGGGGMGGGRSSQLGDAAARNLADAFNQFNTIQNRFISVWLEYEILRRSLDFDMGTMQLDETGAWMDPGLIDNTIGIRAAEAMGISLDCEFCSDVVSNPQIQSIPDSISPKSTPSSRSPVMQFNFNDQGLLLGGENESGDEIRNNVLSPAESGPENMRPQPSLPEQLQPLEPLPVEDGSP